MSERTTTGQPPDTETVSTPCPSVRSGQVSKVRSGQVTNPHSSRSMALADTDEDYRYELVSDLARILCSLRPDWTWAATKAAVRADDRPWRTVVLASVRGATGTDVRHPNGLRYVNPDAAVTTQLPPSIHELRTRPTCQHGAPSGLCGLCRAGIE